MVNILTCVDILPNCRALVAINIHFLLSEKRVKIMSFYSYICTDHICEVNCLKTALFFFFFAHTYILVDMGWIMPWLKPQNHCLKHHVHHRSARAPCHILSAFLQNPGQWGTHQLVIMSSGSGPVAFALLTGQHESLSSLIYLRTWASASSTVK